MLFFLHHQISISQALNTVRAYIPLLFLWMVYCVCCVCCDDFCFCKPEKSLFYESEMNEGNSSNTNHQHVFDVIPLDNADNFLKEDNVILLPLYSLKQ